MKKQTPEELKAIIESAIAEANQLLNDNIQTLKDEVKALRNEYLKKHGHELMYLASIRSMVRVYSN